MPKPPILLAILLPFSVPSCWVSTAGDDGSGREIRRDVTYAEEKRHLVQSMERRMNEFTRSYQQRIDLIQEALQAGLAGLAPPVRLGAVERTLSGYGAAAAERYEAAIDRLVADAVTATEELIGTDAKAGKPAVEGAIERDVWRAARDVGGRAQGAGYGFISGIAEVDELAAVTIELLKGYANVADLRALGALRKGEIIDCSETFRHDVTMDELGAATPSLAATVPPAGRGEKTRLGRLSLFQSDVIEEHRLKEQETIGVVIAFENDRLPAPAGFELFQLVRYRVTRGGMIVEDIGWQPDPTTPNGDGKLDLMPDLTEKRFIASQVFFPAVNTNHSQFDRLRDFTLVFDYKSILVDVASGAAVGGLDWQLSWNVSMTRQVRFVDGMPSAFDPAAGAVLAAVRNGTARPAREDYVLARREPAPSDRMTRRLEATDPANEMPAREVAPGRLAPIAEPIASDHLRITRDGRQYLVARRIHVLADDARFMSYLEGQLGRYVLSLIDIAEGSPLNDLGFRDGDAILSVNGADIRDFRDLYDFLASHPRESRYEFGVLREAAFRRLVFDVDQPAADATLLSNEPLSEEVTKRIDRFFADRAGTIGAATFTVAPPDAAVPGSPTDPSDR